jgi:3-hydroxybutyryl-CoA dehydrogenase
MAIGRLGIVGAGTMGSGIAIASAAHGMDVLLVDAQPSAVAKAKETAAAFFARQAERGRMSTDDAAAATARIDGADDLDDFADCDLVIEAVFEDFDLKARTFRALSEVVRPDCLVATNTSCLKVSDLQAHMAHPERFLGLHYFSPAQVNPIVEVVRGAATGDAAFAAAMTFCEATGKTPLPCKDQYGFAINRFFCPYTNEAARCLDEGLGTTGEIDAVAMDALGAAAGPFFVMNIIKPRINLHAIRNLAPLGAFYAPAAAMATTGDADSKWSIDEPGEVAADRAAAIADRLRLGVFLPTLQALDEGVAEAAVIDHGAREALKMAHPPCASMDRLGRQEVARILAPALARYGLATPAALARVGSLAAGDG